MAGVGGRRAINLSSSCVKTLLTRRPSTKVSPFASKAAGSKLGGPTPSPLPRPIPFSRVPVELGGALSLMPLHNVTASALLTSLLSLHKDKWGCLSEGFATPL